MKLPLSRNFKFNKTWIVLGVAAGIGVLAAFAASNYLSNQMAAIEARAKSGQVNLLVAKRELKKGERLSSDNVAVRPIPNDYAHSGAISPGEFERLEGQALAYPVKSGEMILWSLIEGKKAPTFSARIEPGRRAITVPVDEINSISGMLEPGDTVDLVITIDQKGKKIAFPLLQSVQVMATGQRSIDDPKNGERRQYSTVTLDTTPEQAQNLIVAREAGKLTALLRNPRDKQAFGNGSIDIAALLGSNRNNKMAGGAEEQQIPVLYGGRGGKFPPEALRLGQYSPSYSFTPTEISSDVTRMPGHPSVPIGNAITAVVPSIPESGVRQP